MILLCPHCKCQVNCAGLAGIVSCPHCQQLFAVPVLQSPIAQPAVPFIRDRESAPSFEDMQGREPTPRRQLKAGPAAIGGGKPLSEWDSQFASLKPGSTLLLAILGNGLTLVLGLAGFCTCQNRQATENAKRLAIFSAPVTATGIVFIAILWAARTIRPDISPDPPIIERFSNKAIAASATVTSAQPAEPATPVSRQALAASPAQESPTNGDKSNNNSSNRRSVDESNSPVDERYRISFSPAVITQTLLLDDGVGAVGLPQSRTLLASSGTTFHIVKCQLDLTRWPNEEVAFLRQTGKTLNSSDIILECANGTKITPAYAGCMPTMGSNEIVFCKNQWQNILLTPGKISTSKESEKVDCLWIRIVYPAESEEAIETTSIGQLNYDLSAINITIAFVVPDECQVTKIYHKKLVTR